MNIRVPGERIGVIIGPNGSVRKQIEEKATAKVRIDSETGEVEVVEPQDAVKGMRALEVIQAIGRGFSPEKALRLFDDDMLMLEVIDLSEIARNEKDLQRIKGRLIGSGGKTRDTFERLAGARISVYGKTVSLLGYPEHNAIARTGINMLLEGSPHSPVYQFLEKQHRELKRAELEL